MCLGGGGYTVYEYPLVLYGLVWSGPFICVVPRLTVIEPRSLRFAQGFVPPGQSTVSLRSTPTATEAQDVSLRWITACQTSPDLQRSLCQGSSREGLIEVSWGRYRNTYLNQNDPKTCRLNCP